MAKKKKDEGRDDFLLGLRDDLKALGLKVTYHEGHLYSYHGANKKPIHQLLVAGLICRSMWVGFDGDQLAVSDRRIYSFTYTGWAMRLANPQAEPQKVVDFFRELKALGDKYESNPETPAPAPKVVTQPVQF